MEVDEPTPADFLFGKLPQSIDSHLDRLRQPDKPTKLELLILFTGLSYAIIITFVLNFIDFTQINRVSIIGGIIGLACLSAVSTWKNYLQLERYGADLHQYQMFSVKFMMVQSFISNLILLSILGLAHAALQFIQFVHPAASLFILGLVGFFVYARMISNLSLISAGLGIGLLPSFGGISNLMHNFQLLYQINGQKEYQLASLRVIFWTTMFGLVSLPHSLIYQILAIIGFSAAYINWEKSNGSSIIMQIRGMIQEMSPSKLPDIDFDSDTSYIMTPPNLDISENRSYDADSSLKRPKGKSSIKTPTKNEMNPIAARSINRIASSIINESKNS